MDIDFNYIHQGKSTNLFRKWEDFCKKIIPICKEIIKDKLTKTYLQRLETLTTLEQNGKTTIITPISKK